MKRLIALGACLLALALDAETYVGVSGVLTLPQGGSRMRRLGGAAVRVGHYLNEDWVLEGAAALMEDSTELEVDALWHLQGWRFYNMLFGYSQFDPFLKVGAKGWLGAKDGQVGQKIWCCWLDKDWLGAGHWQIGPKVGLGAFYHLTDAWALRADADATLGLHTDCEMVYTFAVGVQYSF